MGTKNNPGKFDCYENAEPDEPMFVLLGRDKHAPTLVWLWCVLRELDGESEEKLEEARNCVLSMLDWQTEKKLGPVGLGQAALAAVMELIRAANAGVEAEPKNAPTNEDVLRRYLAKTTFKTASV